MNKKAIKIILGVLVTVFLVYFLMTQISLKDLFELFKRISVFWFVLGFVLYAFSYLTRAFRFKMLLNSKIGLKKLFHIVALHSVMNNILPARTGELSYIYLIKRQKIKGTQAASSLIISRIFDVITIILIFLTSIFFLENVPRTITLSLSVVYTLLFIIVILLFILIFFSDKVDRLFRKISNKIGGFKYRFIRTLSDILGDILSDFKSIRSKSKITAIFFVSICIWLFQYLTLYAIVASARVDISLAPLAIAITLMNLSSILPIQGVGGFGTIEGSWVLGLMLFGIGKEAAIPLAFFNHIIIIVYFLAIGLYSFFVLNKSKNI